MNMIKSLWCSFQKCLFTFTMLLVEGTFEIGVFRHLSNHVLGVGNFGNTKAVRVIFFFKIFKIWPKFQKCWKNLRKSFLFLRKLHLNWYRLIVSIIQWPMNMIKALWCRIQECLTKFSILLVRASSQTRFFRYLSDYAFGVRNFENTKPMRVCFLFEIFKI